MLRSHKVVDSVTTWFAHYFHAISIVVPLVSIVVAYLLGLPKELVEFALVPALLLINLLIAWLYIRHEAPKELTPLQSLFSDNLRPSRSSEELRFNTEITVIGDGTTEFAFCTELDNKFRQILDPADQPRLIFRPLKVVPPPENLSTDLRNANSVVVLRTSQLEFPDDAYRAVNKWAEDNSEVPVLFTPLADNPTVKIVPSKIPDMFRWIPKDEKSLPWRLLQRAGERASVWRHQASFNKLAAFNMLGFLVVGILFGIYMLHSERVESHNALSEMQNALDTKSQYEQLANMSGIDVSYWFRYWNEPHAYVTTEKETQLSSFRADKTSIVGCAFEKSNHHAHWDDNTPGYVTLWDFSRNSQTTTECVMTYRPSKPISSILCTSYNSGAEDSPTVGICVFAANGGHLRVDKEALDFLERRTREFHGRTYPDDNYRQLTPLIKRRPWF